MYYWGDALSIPPNRFNSIGNLTVNELGRWESLEMVQRYTRSVTFRDSLKFYKGPLS